MMSMLLTLSVPLLVEAVAGSIDSIVGDAAIDGMSLLLVSMVLSMLSMLSILLVPMC
jgi:hypothetical protein